MKSVFVTSSFALFIVLLLGCGPARAAEPDPAQQENPGAAATASPADAAAAPAGAEEETADAGEETGETPAEKFSVSSVDEAVTRFYEKTAEEQKDMMSRALEGVNKLSPEEQHQLAAAQKDRLVGLSPQQAEQEARDELSSMSPEQQDSMRKQWEHQLQDDPDYRKLNAADRNKALEQVRNFGKDVAPDIVMASPGT